MFESVIGHENVKKILEEDIEGDTVSHAYLFSGIEGIGKLKLALEFAKEILKTSNLNSSPDFKLIQKLDDKKEIIAEQVRESIVNDVYIAPAASDKKVYVINDAEDLNLTSQNVLLKTLEEPPKHAVIILVTSNEKALLTTVLSRVKKVSFNKLSDSDILAYLKNTLNLDISKSNLEYAGGSLKVAIDIANLDEDNKYEKIDKLYEAIKRKNMLKAMRLLEEVSFKDEDTFKYLEYLMLKSAQYDKITIVEKTRQRMLQNANEDIVKQAFLLKIKKGW